MAKKRVKVADANVVQETTELNENLSVDSNVAEDSAVEEVEDTADSDQAVDGQSTDSGSEDLASADDESPQQGEHDILAEVKAELDATHKEAQEHYDKYLRKAAEFENFKKRTAQERSALLKYAGEYIVRDLLDVVDQLQLAVEAENKGTVEEFGRGVEMVLRRFLDIFASHQIRGESAVGQEFDPCKHEALTMVQSPDHKAGIVIQELKRPYFLKDKLLRAGQVVVAAEAPQAEAPKNADTEEPSVMDSDPAEAEAAEIAESEDAQENSAKG